MLSQKGGPNRARALGEEDVESLGKCDLVSAERRCGLGSDKHGLGFYGRDTEIEARPEQGGGDELGRPASVMATLGLRN
ncbi:hypothetical protein M0R45_027424 [Rubus argutus]|uniref:Uncharacterized protein n=1 Tax=Rubus argutus TaxID=59490 RepID=A0AAW1X224_RUBAR